MKIEDLTPAQRVILRDVDPISGRTFAAPGTEGAFKKAAKAGLLEHIHGITYAITDEGKRLQEQL
jgi:hypothetical protein